MSAPDEEQELEYKVVNFFYDDSDSCALTALVNNVWFHVIADADKLKAHLTGSRSTVAGQDYLRLLKDAKESRIEDEARETAASDSEDSGVDVRSHTSTKKTEDTASSQDVAEESLHDWMMAPLRSQMRDLAPSSEHGPEHVTLKEWYTAQTHFFNLEPSDDSIKAVELESTSELVRRMEKLLPQITIPKYIRDLDTEWHQADDLIVLDGSDNPAPYHPTIVRSKADNEIYFLKLVDDSQPQPTKRELTILTDLKKKNLHSQLRCPQLKGLVTFTDPSETNHTKIIGFLQTNIPSATPLTHKLSSDVPQDLRDKWASECHRMNKLLHENNIIWGDAKADNFMVDEDDRLWIIDFGGSYTEGWVDPELSETVEGDDMGVEKIVNALHDPVNNVEGGEDEAEDEDGAAKSTDARGTKRSVDNLEGEVESEKQNHKRPKQEEQGETKEEMFCFCCKPAYGDMVGCDNDDCKRQWFHFGCVGLSRAPAEGEEWFCRDCE